MNKRTCTINACTVKHYAKNMCKRHYSQTQPRTPDKLETVLCTNCNAAVQRIQRTSKRYENAYCSTACQWDHRRKLHPPKPKPPKVGLKVSALTLALESGDYERITAALEQRSEKVGECWEWQGKLDKSGYPSASARGVEIYPHRMAAECNAKAKLGSQAAHHTCGNSRCVNPKHLQGSTYRDNIAEMRARAAYIARIDELEQALTLLDPINKLLAHVPLAGTARHSH